MVAMSCQKRTHTSHYLQAAPFRTAPWLSLPFSLCGFVCLCVCGTFGSPLSPASSYLTNSSVLESPSFSPTLCSTGRAFPLPVYGRVDSTLF